MSATAAARSLPARLPGSGGVRDRWLRPITAPARRGRPRTAYALIAVASLGAIVVAQLLLSIATSQGAYRLADLQAQKARLDRTGQQVSEDLDRLKSPQNLAANASDLGMIQSSAPAYLRLSDGALLGAPTAAVGDTATGAGANLVANSLLTGMPSVTDAAAKPAPSKGVAIPADGQTVAATPGEDPTAGNAGPVAWHGALPSPTTR